MAPRTATIRNASGKNDVSSRNRSWPIGIFDVSSGGFGAIDGCNHERPIT
jgi:hypothetical protein